MTKNVLAIDLGASSGRVIMGSYISGKLHVIPIHRFSNAPIEKENRIYWDLDYLFEEICLGIEKATNMHVIDSIAVNTWGVDYGLIMQNGELLHQPFHYRDEKSLDVFNQLMQENKLENLYEHTGNQLMNINTIFQLLAEKEIEPTVFDNVDRMLMMPDLINYLLTGNKFAEQTIASTTQLFDPVHKKWNREVIADFGLPLHIFPHIIEEGYKVGMTKNELSFPTVPVYSVCSHDTASAVVSVPSLQKFLFVSCGTWSLVGTELDKPIMTEKAKQYNLTNESGVNHSTRFLKNITGLWILQEVKKEFQEMGKDYSYDDFEKIIEDIEPHKSLIDTDHRIFSLPGNMIEKIQIFTTQTNQPVPKSDGEIVRCIYESLAYKYRYTFLEIIDAVGYEYDSVYIIGGGSQSKVLCQMISDAARMTVFSGPVEATAIGNILVQLIGHGDIKNVKEARKIVMENEKIIKYTPSFIEHWEKEFGRYMELLEVEVKI